MSILVAGAVNGVATKINLRNGGVSPITIPYFPGGSSSTLAADTNGINGIAPGHRVAIVAGDTIGRDHFPFSIVTDSGSARGVQYERGIDLGSALQWFWLVKTWKLTGRFSWLTSVGTFICTFGDLVTLSPNKGGAGLITTESDLVICSGIFDNGDPGGDLKYGCTFDTPDGSDCHFESFGIAMFDVGGPAAFWSSPDIGNIYPQFGLGFLVAAGGDDADIEFSTQPTGGLGGFPDPTGHLTVGSGGVEYTVKVTAAGGNVISAHIDLVLVPTEFWPFATKGGLPVYRTSDGFTLNDPLS